MPTSGLCRVTGIGGRTVALQQAATRHNLGGDQTSLMPHSSLLSTERSEEMINSTTAQIAGEPLDGLMEQYRAEVERLNYGRWTINAYLRSIRRLFGLMIEHGVALDELTPDIAAELVLRADWHGARQQY